MSKPIYWPTPESQLPPPHTFQALLDAVLKGDVSETGQLLSAGIHPNAGYTENGLTLLHLAIGMDNFFIIYLLLSSGADLEAEENNGLSPLDYAVTLRRLDAVNILLNFGAPIDEQTRSIARHVGLEITPSQPPIAPQAEDIFEQPSPGP